MADATAISEPLISSKVLLGITGALWAFYGLSIAALVKNVMLNKDLKLLPASFAPWLKGGVAGFFWVNFIAVLMFQTVGVMLAADGVPKSMSPLPALIWTVHWLLLAGHLAISFCAYKGLSAVLKSHKQQPF